MADDKLRKEYFEKILPNTNIIENELIEININDKNINNKSLKIFGLPWTPFQSKPTYPDKLPKENNGHWQVLQEWKKKNKDKSSIDTLPNFHDKIPNEIDILLSHVPPFGIFDQMPVLDHWGSSNQLLQSIMDDDKNIRCLLFGHVHAQRGYWQRNKMNNKEQFEIIGGSEYAKTTHDTRSKGVIYDLMINKKNGIQFIGNSALMSDRTVQPFAKKKLAGQPRVIKGYINQDGQWTFHNV